MYLLILVARSSDSSPAITENKKSPFHNQFITKCGGLWKNQREYCVIFVSIKLTYQFEMYVKHINFNCKDILATKFHFCEVVDSTPIRMLKKKLPHFLFCGTFSLLMFLEYLCKHAIMTTLMMLICTMSFSFVSHKRMMQLYSDAPTPSSRSHSVYSDVDLVLQCRLDDAYNPAQYEDVYIMTQV